VTLAARAAPRVGARATLRQHAAHLAELVCLTRIGAKSSVIRVNMRVIIITITSFPKFRPRLKSMHQLLCR
jgi:hypothetical protein